jgi:8-oxo-dGTP pyrophosphatase MutT (NUDIX family)
MLTFAEQLSYHLEHHLPGEIAHTPLSPSGRGVSSEALKTANNVKESAVAVILFETSNELKCTLIQRPHYEGAHSGQISFPGGKKEHQDTDLLITSMRETFEEIGIQLLHENLVGTLTSVYIPVSNFKVAPYVFYFPTTPMYKADNFEVAEIVEIKIKELLSESVIKQTSIPISNGNLLKDIPYFDLENKIIWGATALILNELREVIKNIQ